MALNTTPAETTAIHENAALPAREIAGEWLTSASYRASDARFIASLRACLAVVDAGVTLPALEVNEFLASSSSRQYRISEYARLSREIEAEILGYAREALSDPETRKIFEEALSRQAVSA